MPPVKDGFWNQALDISEATTDAQVRAAFMQMLAEFGFGAAYFLNPVVSDPRVGRSLLNIGFPKEWQADYEGRLSLIDPFPRAALKRGGAFRWSEIGQIMHLTARQRSYLEVIGGFGMDDGIAMPCYGPGARRSFLGIGMPESRNSFLPATVIRVQMAGQLTFQRYLQLHRQLDLANPRLSPRELEVLQWIASGKSNTVIAEILQISRSTVDVYVKRVFDKLCVADRTSAAVKALSLGLITGTQGSHHNT